ncbi:50S ribosomal protein L32 [Candidatus Mycoplasma haematominutum]|uniref:Large ribosomal subunit protein bL32 n=1 Tax=Candidatus Mycoplasma haematominutum 'Birmingham 1' TaxID=1116213 RepID=G8C2Y3_9MOLU|nr:50S ribosomal protein L32 [Candidatus Mycoplasma haematominutum]CCE66681.1 ribosomal protein L32 [Candidatus Mycoplasma haematominutum 'Birmingham 1']
MAVSPRRVSKSRKGMKNSHDGIRDIAPLMLCPKCARLLKMHFVCKCGYYRNKKIF